MSHKIRRFCRVILLCGLLGALAGCWNRLEPKDLAMVNSVLYDLDNGGNRVLTLELIHPVGSGGGSGGDSTQPHIIQVKGELESEAFLKLSKNIEKVPFGSLNKARLFSEKIASSGLMATLDFFARDQRTDETPYMLLVRAKEPAAIYDSQAGMTQLIGDFIEEMAYQQPNVDNCVVFIRTLAFMKDYYLDGKEPVMGLIWMQDPPEDPKKAGEEMPAMSSGGQQQKQEEQPLRYLRCEGLAAFNGMQLVGFLDGTQTKAFNMLINSKGKYTEVVPAGNGEAAFTLSDVKSDIKVKYEQEQAFFDVKINLTALALQISDTTLDISQGDAQKLLEKAINQHVEKMVQNTVEKVQKDFGSDIFGFGATLHAQNPKVWNEIKEDWNMIFSKAKLQVQANSSIARVGKSKNPFSMEER